MDTEFINLDSGNIASEHLCCIIRTQKAHPGVEAKRAWLAARLDEGHVFRKVNAKGCAFIEYAPLETAWAPVVGDNYLYIYCLWVLGDLKGHGYGRQLMEYCLHDARVSGKSGVCMLGAAKQKAWLSNQAFARKYGSRPPSKQAIAGPIRRSSLPSLRFSPNIWRSITSVVTRAFAPGARGTFFRLPNA